jgi:glycosyltransferase involved in cell wall biosynthesis
MNILQINKGDSLGGAAKVAYRLYQEFKKKKHASYMLVGEKGRKDEHIIALKKEKRSGLKDYLIKGLGLAEFFLYHDKKIINHPFFKQAGIVNLHNLHVRYFNLYQLMEISARKPVVWTLHDMWPISGHCAHSFDCRKWKTGCGHCPYLDTYPHLKFDLTAWLWRKKKDIYTKSQLTIVTPSHWLKKKVEQSLLKDKKIELIYHGVDEQIFKPQNKKKMRKELDLPLNKKIICFVAQKGRSNIWKGGNFLKQIIKNISSDNNKVLVEIGGQKNHQQRRGKLIEIPYLKKEEVLAKYYSAADVFLFPSLAESFGLVVIEAMACGLPVVAFNHGPIKEIVKHLETGYIARYKNLKDLERGINFFLSNKKRLEKFSLKARERVKKIFTLKKQAGNYLRLYRQLKQRRTNYS